MRQSHIVTQALLTIRSHYRYEKAYKERNGSIMYNAPYLEVVRDNMMKLSGKKITQEPLTAEELQEVELEVSEEPLDFGELSFLSLLN